ERLLDNALRLSAPGAPIELRVHLERDDLLGDEVLIFRVVDTIEKIPSIEQFGDGLSEVRTSLAGCDCGLSFVRLGADERPFRKEARITVPVARPATELVGQRTYRRIALALPALLMMLVLGGGALSRIQGGAPVQFAGGGEPVTEFRAEIG